MINEINPERRKLVEAPVRLQALSSINLTRILAGFPAKSDKGYSLPRIAFIGLFQFLSLSDQRHIAKHLGFEAYNDISFGETSGKSLQILVGKWSEIFKGFTRLIVLGDVFVQGMDDVGDTGCPVKIDRGVAWHLFRAYKDSNQPIFVENQIPVIPETELLRLHPDYPAINNSTRWDIGLHVPTTPEPIPKKISATGTQGSFFE